MCLLLVNNFYNYMKFTRTKWAFEKIVKKTSVGGIKSAKIYSFVLFLRHLWLRREKLFMDKLKTNELKKICNSA